MKETERRMLFGISGTLAVVLASVAFAADWPQWRGAKGDAKVADFQLPAAWPSDLKPTWQKTVGAGDATPALVNQKLYVFTREGEQEVTRCLDAKTGEVVWQDKYEPGVSVSGPASSHPGPRSSPAVADGKVVTFGVSGVVSCFNAEDGKKLWRKEPSRDLPQGWPNFYTASSPLIVGDLCIIQSGGRGDGAIVALDLPTGNPKWKANTDAPAYASPALLSAGGQQQIVAQTERGLIGVSLVDGRVLWQTQTPKRGRAQDAASPVVDRNIIIFSGQGQGTSAISIEKQGDNLDVKPLWSNSQVGTSFNTPVLKDGMIYGFSDMGSLFCIDASSGKTMWTGPKRQGERGFGSVVDAGTALFALTPKSELLVFKPGSHEYSQLAAIKLPTNQPYAYPVLDGDRLYVKDQDSVACFTLR